MGTSLAVQRLRLQASNAGGRDSIPDRGTKILHAARHSQEILKRKTKTKKPPKQQQQKSKMKRKRKLP